MKGLNKIALATAVAAAPFATQAMEPMNDSQMGDVTGQAGVTIEVETSVGIDRFEYSQGNSGSFVMNGISIDGADIDGVDGMDGGTFDFGMDIDLKDNGDALISFGPLVEGLAPNLNLSVDEFQLTGDGEDGDGVNTATLMSNLSMDVALSTLDITATSTGGVDHDNGTVTGSLVVDTEFAIANMSADFDVAAASISNLNMAGVGSLDAGLLDNGATTVGALGNDDIGGAVVNMTIQAGDAVRPGAWENADTPYSNPVDPANVLRIDGIDFAADMKIGDISIGGGSIGSVAMNNLQVEADVAIYGRD